MKRPLLFLVVLFFGLTTGCSTIASRIAAQRADFDSWPPAVQAMVKAGQIDLGFTPAQVTVALGEPDRVDDLTTLSGTKGEVWIWHDRSPSYGLGLGSSGYGAASYGAAAEWPDGTYRAIVAIRVTFDHGVVTAIERPKY
jgi:hypothetical protein